MAPKAASEFACPKPRRRKAPPGRKPIRYSHELAERICERIAAGERWRAMACTEGMPSHNAPYKWSETRPHFKMIWETAQRIGADTRADLVLDVAEAATPATLSVDRNHIGALKWHVGRADKMLGRDEPDRALPGQTLVIRVRQFTLYTDENGVERVREVLPDEMAGAKRLADGR